MNKIDKKVFYKKFKFWTLLAVIITAIGALWSIKLTNDSVNLSRQALDKSDSTFQQQFEINRAFISIPSPDIVISENGIINININILNKGNRPIKDLISYSSIFSTSDAQIPFRSYDFEIFTNTIPSNYDVTWRIFTIFKKIPLHFLYIKCFYTDYFTNKKYSQDFKYILSHYISDKVEYSDIGNLYKFEFDNFINNDLGISIIDSMIQITPDDKLISMELIDRTEIDMFLQNNLNNN